MSTKSKDSSAEGFGVFIAFAIFMYAVIFAINALALTLSNGASLIDSFSKYPLAILRFLGLKKASLPFDYSVGWFTFFSLLGCIFAPLIAHLILPKETPRKPFDEYRVSLFENSKLILCLALFLTFVFILWKA